MSHVEYRILLAYALRLLTFHPRSINDVRIRIKIYAQKKSLSISNVGKVIQNLIDENYLNDKEFTRWFVDQRKRHAQKGIQALKYELKQKGIEEEVMQEVLDNEGMQYEKEAAQEMLRKMVPRLQRLGESKIKEKLLQAFYRRRFSSFTIESVIDSFFKKAYNSVQTVREKRIQD